MAKKAKIRLINLHCALNDEVDKDEVFLKYEKKKIWPTSGVYKSVDNGETHELNITFDHEISREIIIELWDYDYLSRNDLLGSFTMKINDNDRITTYYTNMKVLEKGSTASYKLEWELVQILA